MESRLAKELGLRYQPLAVIFTDEKPEGAVGPREGARGCVMAYVAEAARGRTVVFERRTVTCTVVIGVTDKGWVECPEGDR